MKNVFKLLSIVTILTLTYSFKKAPSNNFIGTYGVSENDPSAIQLVIKNDKTYSYQDFSNTNNKINLKGKWELKNNHIILKSDNAETAFHHRWKITKNGFVAKSRKGMTFYTLQKKNN